jgi:diadenosine tetraphosphatase ApaH/serine/threonine PP2A family protein phosphatase
MRYALISDVHANIEALDAVPGRIGKLRVDRIVCLGDTVGYHADPEACLDRLQACGAQSLAGNHDRAAAGVRSALHFGTRARHVIAWTRSRLGAGTLAELGRLPVGELVDGTFFAVHAALHPEPNDELHLSSRERVRASLEVLATGRLGSRLCFYGHTHRPVIHTARGWRLESTDVDREVELELCPDGVQLVNPGSVGQPRDGDVRASFAVYDSRRATVAFHRVAYDWRSCHDKARRAGLFEQEPAHVRSSMWVAARVDDGARLLKRALGAVAHPRT